MQPSPPSATGTVPCPGSWEPIWLCPPPDPEDVPDGMSPEQLRAIAAEAAAEILYALSGRQFGLCEMTFRPCRRECDDGRWLTAGTWWQWQGTAMLPRPVLDGGAWFNLACGGGCGSACSCSPLSEVLLPGPVHDITEVRLDGAVLTPDVDYRLDQTRLLVRLGGHSWPRCQHMERDDSQPGTWSVTAVFGQRVPVSGRIAQGRFACELMKGIVGGDCKLPRTLTNLVRQGVTQAFVDPTEFLRDGITGLPDVDWFIRWANPNGLQAPPQVYDVDAQPQWRRTDTGAPYGS